MTIYRRNFGKQYRTTLAQIEEDAKSVGLTMVELCKEAGITDRLWRLWHTRLPRNVESIVRLQDVVRARRIAAGHRNVVQD